MEVRSCRISWLRSNCRLSVSNSSANSPGEPWTTMDRHRKLPESRCAGISQRSAQEAGSVTKMGMSPDDILDLRIHRGAVEKSRGSVFRARCRPNRIFAPLRQQSVPEKPRRDGFRATAKIRRCQGKLTHSLAHFHSCSK